MPLLNKQVGKYKVYPFYDAGKQHDWMANTFKGYPLTLPHLVTGQLVSWPSSEHYFQASKYSNHPGYVNDILTYSGSYSQFPKFAAQKANEYGLPKLDLTTPEGRAWHGTGMNGYKHQIMRTAVYQKTLQYPQLKDALLQTEPDSIIVEATANDKYWADGGDGTGTNHLGIIWMEVRNYWLAQKNQPSTIVNPEKTYQEFQVERAKLFGTTSLDLLPDTLGQTSPSIPGTYQGGSSQLFMSTPLSSSGSHQHQNTSQPQLSGSSAAQRVKEAILNIGYNSVSAVCVDNDIKQVGKYVVKISFTNPQDMHKFALYAGGAPTGNDNKTVILGEIRASQVFEKLGVPKHGRSNPHAMFNALVFDHTNNLVVSEPYTGNSGAYQPGISQSFWSTPSSSPSTYQAQSSQSQSQKWSSAAQRVKEAILKAGYNFVSEVSVANDINQAGKKVIKIKFTHAQDVNHFAQYAGGAPIGNDNQTVILGEARAKVIFKKLGVEFHGRTNPHPMFDALVHDDKVATNSETSFAFQK